MGFQDLEELIPLSKKRLPIGGGREHEFPDRISAESGALLLLIQKTARERTDLGGDLTAILKALNVDDAHADRLMEDVLGMPAAELLAMVSMNGDRMLHIFKTLMVWHLAGQEAAEEAWSQVGNPKAPTKPRKATPSKGKAPAARRGSRVS